MRDCLLGSHVGAANCGWVRVGSLCSHLAMNLIHGQAWVRDLAQLQLQVEWGDWGRQKTGGPYYFSLSIPVCQVLRGIVFWSFLFVCFGHYSSYA